MRAVVIVPTYNESENVVPLLEAIRDVGVPGLEVLVVDDASPDGTAALVRAFAERHPFADVLDRTGRPRGRGHAGRDGYLAALARGADYVIEMDGDLSHDPRYLPDLLAAARSGGASSRSPRTSTSASCSGSACAMPTPATAASAARRKQR